MSKKCKILLILCAIFIILLIAWIIWGNSALELTEYTISSKKVPKEFSGFKIAQVSDLHNAQMGENNKKLLKMLADAEPDIIVITGDLIDAHKTDLGVAVQFAKDALTIAPCYYVTGNNESYVDAYDVLKKELLNAGVTVLDDTLLPIQRQNTSISLIGVNDPAFQADYVIYDEETVMTQALDSVASNDESFQVLLSHRPEFFSLYVSYGFDLVLSGHVHGGQFRLPFIGGLYGPNQGFFPYFDAGLFQEENTSMIVSRGIGNSRFPFRINNRPELIVVTLESE